MDLSPKSKTKSKNTGFIYITRNFKDVSKSVFNLRNRFGLRVSDYNTFLKKPYGDMWAGNLEVDVVKQTLSGKEEHIYTVSNVFKGVPLTPQEYFRFHNHSWKLSAKNVCVVSYDNMMSDFDAEMRKISSFLGSSVKSFQNIKARIGWRPNEV